MLIEGLIALGKEDLAALAYAHYSRTNMVINPVARLAGAKALALIGETASAIEALQRLCLGFPHTGWGYGCQSGAPSAVGEPVGSLGRSDPVPPQRGSPSARPPGRPRCSRLRTGHGGAADSRTGIRQSAQPGLRFSNFRGAEKLPRAPRSGGHRPALRAVHSTHLGTCRSACLRLPQVDSTRAGWRGTRGRLTWDEPPRFSGGSPLPSGATSPSRHKRPTS